MIVLIYVDDLIILASLLAKLASLKAKVNAEFMMSDLGELTYCLRVEFKKDRNARTITMSQRKYTKDEAFQYEEVQANWYAA